MDKKRLIFTLLAFALILRVFWVFVLPTNELTGDPKAYYSIAQGLIEGEGYHELGKRAFRPPGYPFFLALIFSTFGLNILPVKLIQILLGVFTGFIVFRLTQKLCGETPALFVLFLFSIYPQFIRYPENLYVETLFIFLLYLSMYFLFSIHEKPTYAKSIMAGVLMGFAALTREVAFIMLFPIVGWMLLHLKGLDRKKEYALKYIVFFICFTAAILPWTVRNYFLFHKIVLFSSNGGFNFFMGNNPQATGEYSSDLDSQIKWIRPFPQESEDLLELEIESSREGYRQGINFIVNNPGQFVRLSLKKLFLFWRPPYYNLSFRNNFRETLYRLVWLACYLIVVILAIPGMVMAIKKFGTKWSLFHFLIIVVTGVHMLVFSATRFRLPLIPIMMIFAALTLNTIRSQFIIKKEQSLDTFRS